MNVYNSRDRGVYSSYKNMFTRSKSFRLRVMTMYFDTISIKWTAFLVFLRISCRVSSESLGLCGSRFDDLPSRTVSAPIVFEGKAQSFLDWTVKSGPEKGRYYNFTFSVDTVFKGSLPRRDNGKEYRSLVVGVFGEKGVRTKCVSPKVEIGLSYIVFLNSTIYGRAERLNIYRITSFPEIALNQTIETVRSYSCSKCGQPPKCRIQTRRKTNGTIGNKLQLRCKVTGRPFPQVKWVKDGRPLVPKKGLRIRPHSQGSSLQIGKLTEEDSGLYECQAVNVLGSSEWSRIQVTAMHQRDSLPCANQNYCLHNGTCYMLQSLSIRYCHCKERFEGKRCELKRVDVESVNNGPQEESPFEKMPIIMPVVGMVLAVAMIICIVILSYCIISSCLRRRQAKRVKEDLENSYRPYSLGIREDSLKSNRSGKRKSVSSVPLLKDGFTQTEGSLTPAKQFAIVRPDSLKTVVVESDQPRNASTKSGSASSSIRRGRLNGCSVTPPDFSKHKSRVHSPIMEIVSVSSDVREGHKKSRICAVEASPGNQVPSPEIPVDSIVQCEESKRNSEYDNCCSDDNKEVFSKDLQTRLDKTFNQATSSDRVEKIRTSHPVDIRPR